MIQFSNRTSTAIHTPSAQHDKQDKPAGMCTTPYRESRRTAATLQTVRHSSFGGEGAPTRPRQGSTMEMYLVIGRPSESPSRPSRRCVDDRGGPTAGRAANAVSRRTHRHTRHAGPHRTARAPSRVSPPAARLAPAAPPACPYILLLPPLPGPHMSLSGSGGSGGSSIRGAL